MRDAGQWVDGEVVGGGVCICFKGARVCDRLPCARAPLLAGGRLTRAPPSCSVCVCVRVCQAAAAEAARTLSKKELKAKEMAELDSVFAEMGINVADKKEGQGESKNAKKKKKKKAAAASKASEGADGGEQQQAEAPEAAKEPAPEEPAAAPIDPAEAKRRLMEARAKAAKGKKGGGGAASAAAKEAAARNAKAAAAKKKDKKTHNQAPRPRE